MSLILRHFYAAPQISPCCVSQSTNLLERVEDQLQTLITPRSSVWRGPAFVLCFLLFWHNVSINCIYLPYTFALAGVSYIGTARILHCAFLAFFTWYSIVASKNFYIIAWNQFVCFHKNLCWFYEQCQCRHCYVTLWIKCFEGRGVPSSILDRQQQSLVRLGNLAPTLNQMHNILHKAKSIIAC